MEIFSNVQYSPFSKQSDWSTLSEAFRNNYRYTCPGQDQEGPYISYSGFIDLVNKYWKVTLPNLGKQDLINYASAYILSTDPSQCSPIQNAVNMSLQQANISPTNNGVVIITNTQTFLGLVKNFGF